MTKDKMPGEDPQKNCLGYVPGKWYLVRIDYEVFVPAKFIGFKDYCESRNLEHDFMPTHPGLVFENIGSIYGCGFTGTDWINPGGMQCGRYTGFIPAFQEVTETELWAVRAIEEFQKIIAGRKLSFKIQLPDGYVFQGKIIKPSKKENLAGQYFAKLIDPKTSEKKEGVFNYDGKSESALIWLTSKLQPGWIITDCKLKKASLPRLNPKK